VTTARDALGDLPQTRAALVAELRRLEDALRDAQGALAALGGTEIPGLHLLVEAGGRRGLLPAARVSEILRLVAFAPLAGAPPDVLGTFVCRGVPVIALDLAARLGVAREPSLDAQIVVLGGAPSAGLVVDRVVRLVDGPRLLDGDAEAATPDGWRGSPLVAGLCVEDGEVLPLVDVAPLLAGLRERA
jgi:purine-binding chemotaxis protein CheW